MRIEGPFLAMMGLTFVVWAYLYVRRLAWMAAVGRAPQTYALGVPTDAPAAVLLPPRNFANLAELPILFYGLCLYAMLHAEYGAVDVWLAWGFVGFRALHSLVHCTVNIVLVRFGLYVLSAVCLWAMLTRAVFALAAA
ncbi:MAG: MAPEG family protein [Pseudomonadota bacterium]